MIGLEFINKALGKEKDYSIIIRKFDDIFPSTLPSDNFLRCAWLNKGEDWRNLNKLEEIRFGNFKLDLKDRIERLINILE